MYRPMTDLAASREGLYRAAETGDIHTVRRTLDRAAVGVEDLFSDVHGTSALHVACSHGFLDIVECLLQHEADPNIVDLDGKTPLHHASASGHNDILPMLEQAGAFLEPRDVYFIFKKRAQLPFSTPARRATPRLSSS